MLYDVLSQGASKLPEVNVETCELYLVKMAFFELFTLTFGNSDAPLGKISYST